VVDVNAIELPAVKVKEQKAFEITQDVVRTSFVLDCITILYLSRSDGEKSENSESDAEATIVVLQGHVIKTDLTDDPDNNSWNVMMKDLIGHGETFKVKEKELLGGNFVIKRASYNNMSAKQKKAVLAKHKWMRQKDATKQ
jgi:hypothetical protein